MKRRSFALAAPLAARSPPLPGPVGAGQAADTHPGGVSAWRLGRHRGAAAGRQDARHAGPERDRRQQARRRRPRRAGRAEARRARRPDPGACAQRRAGGAAVAVQEPRLRPGQGLHARGARGDLRLRDHRRPRGAARRHQGHPGLDESQSGQGQLRHAGRRHGAALHRRAAQPGRRHPDDARGLQGRRPGDERPARRPGAADDRHAAGDDRAAPRRQAAHRGRHRRDAHQVAARRADAQGVGHPDRRPTPSSACTARRAWPATSPRASAARWPTRLQQPDVSERIFSLGLAPAYGTGEELAATQAAHLKRWEAPIKASGFTVE